MRKLIIVLVAVAPVMAAAIVLFPLVHPAAAPVRHAKAVWTPAPAHHGHQLKETHRRG
ncbi:MAG TPA: hypothetical protein VGH15_01960 [Caulobacteraceae bacterium]